MRRQGPSIPTQIPLFPPPGHELRGELAAREQQELIRALAELLRAVGGGATAAAAAARKAPERAPERARPKRLSYREQREWEGLEQAILDAEGAVEARQRDAEDPAITSDPTALQQRYAALEVARAEVDRLYGRWAELGAKQEA